MWRIREWKKCEVRVRGRRERVENLERIEIRIFV